MLFLFLFTRFSPTRSGRTAKNFGFTFLGPDGLFFVYAAPCRALTCLSAPVWKMSRVRFYLQILSAVGSGCSGAGGKISGRKKKYVCECSVFLGGLYPLNASCAYFGV